ncbi:Uncharacterized protein dnm_091280 [Desulfonema magnum]|uniref:Uncharacterized protein n=1 Tax=Desulfonema magnum TaxID=45655 RepID=A0A975BXB8_9BACT|nr:Uncharacterized protein dnm_091280 [Desulfonema magnum]
MIRSLIRNDFNGQNADSPEQILIIKRYKKCTFLIRNRSSILAKLRKEINQHESSIVLTTSLLHLGIQYLGGNVYE